MRIAALTLFTLIAFAANSVLCRMALGGNLIDPMSFTTLRLVSGAAALLVILRFADDRQRRDQLPGSWSSAAALFVYAAAFSLAYVSLPTGAGALILFGSVQVTMIGWALYRGERPGMLQWTGLVIALSGLAYLVSPGIAAPAPVGAALMTAAGIAWGVYSIRGRGVTAPVAMTAGNFARTAPLALVGSAIAMAGLKIEPAGVMLALVSGVVTSGLGYVLWYRTLPALSTAQASIVQLLVPIIAAAGGIVFLAEAITSRLAIASVLILGGVALGVLRPAR